MERAVRVPDGRTLAVEDAGIPLAASCWSTGARPTRVTCIALGWPIPPGGACGSSAMTRRS